MARIEPPKEHRFTTENQPEGKGRPKGARNRSTIVKAVFGANVKTPEAMRSQLEAMFPGISNNLTVEEAITMMQAKKAIEDSDTNAYKALMDSAYGAPKQETDLTTKGESINHIPTKEEAKKILEDLNNEY